MVALRTKQGSFEVFRTVGSLWVGQEVLRGAGTQWSHLEQKGPG